MTSALGTRAGRIAARMAAMMAILTPSQFSLGQEPPKNFIMHDAPKPIAALKFDDADGRSRSLADFSGKVVLLNIWATWCVPCRKEMPALDRLQAALGGPEFDVVALSIDRGGMDAVRKFFAELGVRHLAIYLDGTGKAMRELGAVGLPLTLLVGRDGLELGRLIGPAEWDSAEAIAFVRSVIADSGTAKPETDPRPAAPPANATTPSKRPRRRRRRRRMTTAPESRATTLPESIPLAEAQLLSTPPAEAPVSTPPAETPPATAPAETPLWCEALNIARYYLGNRWVLLALGGVALVVGASLNWGWLVAAGIAPILIAAAPCAIMCALGLCAMKMTGGSK